MKRKEKVFEIIFLIVACISIAAVACICIFLFANGIPAMGEIGLGKFLGGTTWRPGNDLYGIFPMIIGSLYITGGAILLGVPVGIFAAVFLARYCPKGIYKIVKPATAAAQRVSANTFLNFIFLSPFCLTFSGLFSSKSLSFLRVLSYQHYVKSKIRRQ